MERGPPTLIDMNGATCAEATAAKPTFLHETKLMKYCHVHRAEVWPSAYLQQRNLAKVANEVIPMFPNLFVGYNNETHGVRP